MKIFLVILMLLLGICCFSFSLHDKNEYVTLYWRSLTDFKKSQSTLLESIRAKSISTARDREEILEQIRISRGKLKAIDFWLRYFEPVAYRKLNGPLPVEWETEVFEKFEPPYKRKGAGLSLAEQYLEEDHPGQDSLAELIKISIDSLQTFEADSITSRLDDFGHFFLANRLYLLNLAAIYTTGFECPDSARVIPELREMLHAVRQIYIGYNSSFPKTALTNEYLQLYDRLESFADQQPGQFTSFDHFALIRDYINPLFRMNQGYIVSFGIGSVNYNDYALNNDCQSIFDKSLFISQNSKGIFSLVDDPAVLAEIRSAGKLLFYDPILSGNNKRSCASCHKPTEYFTDTSRRTAFQFEQAQQLPRNTPSLINAVFNHLSMLDGKHISLQGQAREVIQSHFEMNSNEKALLKKVMSCDEYKKTFKKLLAYTPEEKTVSLSHIVSAITYYYADFSNFYSPFDDAMNKGAALNDEARKGFNLFMSKAQCATCHFVPHFNGVKPPYISSEFEVLGVPADTNFSRLSEDQGRYIINPAPETLHAFRTGSIRNSSHTKPYMHNGVFSTLEEVIDFYDAGGGIGKKLRVDNQTLSSDSLHLSPVEKRQLIAFMNSLDENIIFETPPGSLPSSRDKSLNGRKIGGEY